MSTQVKLISLEELEEFENITDPIKKIDVMVRTILSINNGKTFKKYDITDQRKLEFYQYWLCKSGLNITYSGYGYNGVKFDNGIPNFTCSRIVIRDCGFFGGDDEIVWDSQDDKVQYTAGNWENRLAKSFYKSREKLKKVKTKAIGQKKNG